MSFIEDEIEAVKKFCLLERFQGLRLVTAARAHVRVEISKSNVKTVAAIFQFPPSYPSELILVELKSKTLGENFLKKLEQTIEEHAKNYLDDPQICRSVEFLYKFIEENPLCCCADEIAEIKREVLSSAKDEMKLKQKNSSIIISFNEGLFQHKISLCVPENYPESRVTTDTVESNFPLALQRFFQGQMTEIARRCVEPPLNKRKIKPNEAPFKPRPSVLPVVSFISEQIHVLPNEKCCFCNECCLPANPVDSVSDEQHDLHVERVYCGHLYHLKCLIEYMKTPPFDGGKKCVKCGKQIFHEKYKLSPALSEARWAHQQARQRELDEVAEFLS
ncbi:unnamed protein product [Allacma fusca]|uniref:RWD domain-containing protein n=1 Tax=Allacma fusca TaxID=39272 RepID=A0A8J2L6W8_9HEXA|nr:unnamed protein product [Allacma fusca]